MSLYYIKRTLFTLNYRIRLHSAGSNEMLVGTCVDPSRLSRQKEDLSPKSSSQMLKEHIHVRHNCDTQLIELNYKSITLTRRHTSRPPLHFLPCTNHATNLWRHGPARSLEGVETRLY